jgi:hypothetical protein
MSKRINVNPDHYKGSGRERPGDSEAAKATKHPAAPKDREAQDRWDRRQSGRMEKGRR